MQINIILLDQYLTLLKCPTQIYLNTDDTEWVLRFLKGADENGSRAEYLSIHNIKAILAHNNVEADMIQMRDLPVQELRSLGPKKQDKQKNINDILYGTLAKYVIQLFAAGTEEILFPELNILDIHKRSHFASIFNQS